MHLKATEIKTASQLLLNEKNDRALFWSDSIKIRAGNKTANNKKHFAVK